MRLPIHELMPSTSMFFFFQCDVATQMWPEALLFTFKVAILQDVYDKTRGVDKVLGKDLFELSCW